MFFLKGVSFNHWINHWASLLGHLLGWEPLV